MPPLTQWQWNDRNKIMFIHQNGYKNVFWQSVFTLTQEAHIIHIVLLYAGGKYTWFGYPGERNLVFSSHYYYNWIAEVIDI